MSARQAEIAGLVASGKSNRQIAEVLYLSPRTVETHVAALFTKLGVRSRSELAAFIARDAVVAGVPAETVAKTNLPIQLKSLIGREAELAQLQALLDAHRLITISGTGGVGKTRTALEVGFASAGRFRDGVWFVELAQLADGTFIAAATARALGIAGAAGRSPAELLVRGLRTKSLLLLLDNCEHLVDGAATFADTLLKSCPAVHIIATSREPLKVGGEYIYRLPSLGVPAPETIGSLQLDDAIGYGAIVLFAERAQAIDQRFALTNTNAAIVADICARLDGIPLAIELAAARVKILSVTALSKNLDDRFQSLGRGERTALPRHQTMHALIDWSYDLLSRPEQRLFEHLSVFSGGCTLKTARAVFEPDRLEETDVLELLSSLVDKSLAIADLDNQEARYRLLQSSRHYAREKLAARGDEAAALENHAAAFLKVAAELEQTWDAAPDRAWRARAQADLENFRSAVDWALTERADVLLGQRLVATLQPVWTHFACAEGKRYVRAALALTNAQTPGEVVAHLNFCDAVIALASGDIGQALCAGKKCLTEFGALEDSLATARASHIVGLSLLYHDRFHEGEALLHEALVTLRRLGQQRYVAFSLARLAFGRSRAGDIETARTYYSEALAIFAAAGAERGEALIASNLAEAEFLNGNISEALRLARVALPTYRGLGDANLLAQGLHNVSAYLVAMGQCDSAVTVAREALMLARDQQLDTIVAWALQDLAAIAALRPAPLHEGLAYKERAARLLAFVDAHLAAHKIDRTLDYTEQQEYDRAKSALGSEFDLARLTELRRAGSAMTQEVAIEEALLI